AHRHYYRAQEGSEGLRQPQSRRDPRGPEANLGAFCFSGRRAMEIKLFDTTLRDGTQSEGLSLSVEDKLKIARLLDQFGVHFIEGGWPASNPKDSEFFRRARSLGLRHALLTAFGSTRKAGGRAEDDANLRGLLEAETPAVAIFGKSWILHVTKVLGT